MTIGTDTAISIEISIGMTLMMMTTTMMMIDHMPKGKNHKYEIDHTVWVGWGDENVF
jgi:hypothetical protein